MQTLSDFFRASLNSGKDIVSLEGECRHITSYLQIQQVRYQDILTYSVDIPEEIANCKIPKITLQPLVENALYHGIKYKRGKGKITVTGRRENDKCVIRVEDDENGKAVDEVEIHTAGKPHHIVLTADRDQLQADGKDLSFINVKIVDKDGNFCPNETRQIKLKVKGAGTFRAAANGNSASLESFQEPQMKLFSGQLTAIVQSAEEAGTITFEASAPGVKSAKLILKAE